MEDDIRIGDWVRLKQRFEGLEPQLYKVNEIERSYGYIYLIRINGRLVPCEYFEEQRINKYRVGEHVMISGMTLKSPGVCSEMMKYEGRKAVVTDVNPQLTVWYRLDIDDSSCWWHESILRSDNGLFVVDTKNDIKIQAVKDSTESYLSNFNLKNNENQLQRQEGVDNGRSNRTGSVICGRRRETSVAVGHLSNQTCPGK